MSYICLNCGNVFEDGDQIYVQESLGECFGVPCYKNISGCPNCGGEYEESNPCQICGKEFLEDDLSGGLCDDCIDKYKHDVDMCFKIGDGDTEKIELNCFLASMFEKQEIEEILFRELKEREKYMKELLELDCEKFINSDRSWFGERLLEELEKEKR